AERVDVSLRLERCEDVVRDRAAVAAAGAADTDPQPQELGRSERLRDRAQAVVAGEPAPEPRLEASLLEVDVVVDDGERLRRRLEEAHRGGDRPARLVHVRL